MVRAPYFLVHRVEIANGGAFVDGRLGEAAIRKGHIFSRSFESVEAWRGETNESLACRLVLVGIEAYRRPLEELSGGMTARLRFEGDSVAALAAAKVIT